MRYHLTEQLGPNQQLTPEGYLLCEAVPIARTGTQIYAAIEHPDLEPGPDGLITVIREPSEVFRPETIASFEGKSITIGHAFVDPDNFSDLEVGQALNVRQHPMEPDLLVADLLFKDRDAIEKVRVKKGIFGTIEPQLRGISCGYDADYVQEQPGIAYQRNIIGNHVAVVRNPRGGARLSIQDEDYDMSTKNPTLLQKLLRAIRTGDENTLKRTVDEVEAEEKKTADEEAAAAAEAEKKKTADEMADLRKTIDAMAGELEELKKTKDSIPIDAAGKTEMGTNPVMDNDLASEAETIAPGMPLPTMDAAAGEAGLAAVKRKVLNAGLKGDGKEVITKLLRGKTVDSLSDDAVGLLFSTAAERIGEARNAAAVPTSHRTVDEKVGKVPTNDEINARNREFYKV